MAEHRTLRQIFAAPLVVAVLSGIGLVTALVGDGVWDMVSWLSLTLPILLYVFFVKIRSRRS
ncbi:hypothetical protein LPW26_20180 [Rhodopseudomonas sp. HC1]|uniref:hypothetical protein n=1 Tax=Rhodopseudomonas infernalis TaxID=2897386 RepID=UPI001EE8F94F|nr:hypothetical protein [Rhodopseudomonas infernalis]MCG6206968.1 hypothetical protein [Rhodopseudomonas infernalis]